MFGPMQFVMTGPALRAVVMQIRQVSPLDAVVMVGVEERRARQLAKASSAKVGWRPSAASGGTAMKTQEPAPVIGRTSQP